MQSAKYGISRITCSFKGVHMIKVLFPFFSVRDLLKEITVCLLAPVNKCQISHLVCAVSNLDGICKMIIISI